MQQTQPAPAVQASNAVNSNATPAASSALSAAAAGEHMYSLAENVLDVVVALYR